MNKKNIDITSLIKDNEPLVYKISSKYSSYYNLDDLYQAGMIGIIKAGKKYDSESNCKFSTYAYKYILGEIIDFIKRDRNIIISDEAYKIYKKYIHIKDLLFNKYGRESSLKEICSIMEIEEADLVKILQSVVFTKEIERDNDYYIDDTERVIDKILIDEEIERLDEEDKKLIDYRYYQGFTQSETASIMGISQVKVSRCEKMILTRIKNNIVN